MKPNVLFVVLDTVRAKSCGYHGRERDTTANIDALRSESVSFDRAIAPATWTIPSHAAMFTGKYASELGVHPRNKVLPDGEETIASRLSADGYSTALLSSNPFLTEGSQLYRGVDYRHTSGMRRTLFKDAFDPAAYIKRREYEHGLPKFQELASELAAPPQEFAKNLLNAAYYKYRTTWKPSDEDSKYDPDLDDGAGETITRFQQWVAAGRQPFYACLNFMEAHTPYRYRTDYLPDDVSIEDVAAVSQNRDAYFRGEEALTDHAIEVLEALYEAEIRYLDEQLEALWAFLRDEDLWDDTLVVVTSDHGEYVGEHGLVFHHHNRLSDPLIHVPLLVKYPGGAHGGESVSTPVDLTQVYDTVMDVTGAADGDDAGGGGPLRPGVEPEMVKSEYVCKEPSHSTEGYLEKYEDINTPSRAVFDGESKYLLFESGRRAFVKDGIADDGGLDAFEELELDAVPRRVREFANLEYVDASESSLDVSNSVQDRLENLGYQ